MRSKGGNANSFNTEAPNIIDSNLRAANDDVFNYFKNAISLRRAHPALRMTTWEVVNRNITTTIQRSNDVIVDDIQGTHSGVNFDYSLPAGNWRVAMERSLPVQMERVVTGSITAGGTAVTVLHR